MRVRRARRARSARPARPRPYGNSILRESGSSRSDSEPARRVVRTRARTSFPWSTRLHDFAAAPRTLPKTATRGVSKVEAPLARPRAVGRAKRPRRRRAGDPATRRDASSASPAHVELSNASTASSSSQYAPSEAVDAARARWAKAFVDAGCATSHHAAALVASNAGDRRYGEVGFWTSALILRAAGPGARIADLGSGVGRFTLAAALLMPEARVLGVEIAPELHVHDCVEMKFRTPHASTRRRPRNCLLDATNLTG